MSAPLVVSIPHRLGREEACRRLKTGLTRAAASLPALKVDEEKWEGDR
ncbi:MAG TPA: polyhydroxyalkanoic acid synthase, partial [Bradyrhizobium sp.]|nr:polyhydroxyalkanoic acid synthase [Bradyrhizobium sp.]